jgi:hypothetical protein
VNAAHIAKIAMTEIMDAALLGETALSSPKVTVFKLVKSSCDFVKDEAILTI